MKSLLLNRRIYLLAILALGIGVGGVGGVVAYFLADQVMPWMTKFQMSLILPGFLLMGLSFGIWAVIVEHLRTEAARRDIKTEGNALSEVCKTKRR